MQSNTYPIGTPGVKWQQAEKAQWLSQQQKKRSYTSLVLSQIDALKAQFSVSHYGDLNYAGETFPLYALTTQAWQNDKPTILITGGVHGYETSGVMGALAFAKHQALLFSSMFNFVIVPCVSPWGFETINRWNPDAIDPNRSFFPNSPAQESALLMAYIADLTEKGTDFIAHVDLHETTDTDNSEFRPALAARDGTVHDNWNIPDGFYLVGDTQKPADAFQKTIIGRVSQVTHIAPADEDGCLIGVEIAQFGVCNYDCKALYLCAGLTDAPYVTTTEVYPDSPKANDQNCIDAQVAAVLGAIDYLQSL